MSAPVRDWNADAYHRVSDPLVEMALKVLDRLTLRGDETVLDAGCGSGRVTQLLLERLPRGRVIAVDSSPDMVVRARAELGERADVRLADLAELQLEPGEAVDAVLSTATFHWVPDHDALFASLAAALRPGGTLVAQCGGEGNIAGAHAAVREAAVDAGLADRFEGWAGPWNFASPAVTHERLTRAGFDDDARCWLEPWPVEPADPRAYLETVCLGPFLERLAGDEPERFLDAVLTRLGDRPTLDYVRLNIVARRR